MRTSFLPKHSFGKLGPEAQIPKKHFAFVVCKLDCTEILCSFFFTRFSDSVMLYGYEWSDHFQLNGITRSAT